ncbi:hypothetical protein H0H93_011613 [Arthromyces matolae]|nr:hypothetical protein H0H93_011613 [Arthromyces matolae]
MSTESHSATCTQCQAVFTAATFALAKNQRDYHFRACVKQVEVTYANGVFTIVRDPESNNFICICSSQPEGHAFGTTMTLKSHVQKTKCTYLGQVEVSLLFGFLFSTQGLFRNPQIPAEISKDHLIAPPAIHALGLAINTQLNVLVCLDCQVALAPKHVFGHVKNNHREMKSLLDLPSFEALVKEHNIPSELPQLGIEIRAQVQGLSLHDGLQCQVCQKIYGSYGSIHQHHHEQHKGEAMPSSWPKVHAQRLDNALNRSLFPVQYTPVPMTSTELIIKNINEGMATTNVATAAPDARMVSPWLKSTLWLDLITGKSITGLIQLVAPLAKGELPGLTEGVHELFVKSGDIFNHVPELIRQRLNTADPAKTYVPKSSLGEE